MDTDCLFCRILAGEIPATEVASSATAYAFRDLNPTAPTHVLVIPRQHIAGADELDMTHGDLLAGVFDLARRVAVEEGVAEGGYRLVFNVGADAGQTVPHLHLHVIGGRRLGWPPG